MQDTVSAEIWTKSLLLNPQKPNVNLNILSVCRDRVKRGERETGQQRNSSLISNQKVVSLSTTRPALCHLDNQGFHSCGLTSYKISTNLVVKEWLHTRCVCYKVPKKRIQHFVNQAKPKLVSFLKLIIFLLSHTIQGWPSGESTGLSPMWPGFDFRTRCHMWIEFVGSLPCYERFSPGYSGFPLSSKTLHLIWFVNNDCKNNDLGNVDLISTRIVKRIWSYSYANLRHRNIKHYYYY